MFEFIESSGIALGERAHRGSGRATLGGRRPLRQPVPAWDGGARRRSAARVRATPRWIKNAGTPGTGERPMGWRLGEGGDAGLSASRFTGVGLPQRRGGRAAPRGWPEGESLQGDEARNRLKRCVSRRPGALLTETGLRHLGDQANSGQPRPRLTKSIPRPRPVHHALRRAGRGGPGHHAGLPDTQASSTRLTARAAP